jgi:hypothetical protein
MKQVEGNGFWSGQRSVLEPVENVEAYFQLL